jgi:hypothetical protein
MVAQHVGEPNAIMLASLVPLGIAGLLWVLAPTVRALE